MKNNFLKGIFAFLFLFVLEISSVNANTNIIDFSKHGSINISLIDSDNIGVANTEISIYKIADAGLENTNLIYENIEQLSSCNIDLSTISDASITYELINCVEKNSTFKSTEVTDTEGKVQFNDLDLGLYLVVQTQKTPGYSTIAPFMVAIPQISENNWIYNINSLPKSDIYKVIDINVKKIWNNEGHRNPDSVTVELIKYNEVIDQVILSADNDWNYTWKDIALSDGYSVREVKVPSNYTVSYQNEGYNFIVTNTRKLPQTGLRLWLVDIFVISGVILLVIGISLRKKYENIK